MDVVIIPSPRRQASWRTDREQWQLRKKLHPPKALPNPRLSIRGSQDTGSLGAAGDLTPPPRPPKAAACTGPSTVGTEPSTARAGPSTVGTGPSTVGTGPSTGGTELSTPHAGSSTTRAGPSTDRVGSSTVGTRISTALAGPSTVRARPSAATGTMAQSMFFVFNVVKKNTGVGEVGGGLRFQRRFIHGVKN